MKLSEKDDEFPLEIVNVVGSGDLRRELDLEQITQDIDPFEVDLRQGMGALFLTIKEGSGLIILYRSGKYIVRGGKEYEKLYETNQEFLESLEDLEIIPNKEDIEFDINNVVFVGDIGQDILLERLMIKLGMENAEFEPEQFPGLVYRPTGYDCVLLVFGSGKVSITGSSSEEVALDAFNQLKEEVEELQ